MDIQFYGANCIKISTKKCEIVVDDNLADLGRKSIIKAGEVALFTDVKQSTSIAELKLLVNQAGEYEVSDTLIQGVAARAYDDEPGKFSSTIFKISYDETSLVVVGHVSPDLSDSQLEILSGADILMIPVGNNEVTLSGTDALKIIKEIEPSIVIPTHYQSEKIKYPKNQASLADALKELAMEPSETVAKLKLKANSSIEEDTTRLVVLEISG